MTRSQAGARHLKTLSVGFIICILGGCGAWSSTSTSPTETAQQGTEDVSGAGPTASDAETVSCVGQAHTPTGTPIPVNSIVAQMLGERYGGASIEDSRLVVYAIAPSQDDCAAFDELVSGGSFGSFTLSPVGTSFDALVDAQMRIEDALTSNELADIATRIDVRRNSLVVQGEDVSPDIRGRIEQAVGNVSLIYVDEPLEEMRPAEGDS